MRIFLAFPGVFPTALSSPDGSGSPRRSSCRRPIRRGSLCAGLGAALLLGGCGGGGGSGDEAIDGDALVLAGSDGRAASEVETEALLRSAAARASAGLGLNLGNLRRLDEDDEAGGSSGGEDVAGGSDELLTDLENGNEGLLERTLGIDDEGARVEREGDLITIDPDDARLCEDESGTSYDDGLPDLYRDAEAADGAFDDGELSACRQLVADLTVRLDARAEDAGVITYLFDRESVLSIGYSPGGVVYELRLAGVRSVLRRIDAIFGGEDGGDGVPTTLRGTLRLAARVLDDTEGAEAGELELDVTEAIAISDDSGPGEIVLEPSRVFRISADEASGEASLDVDWGALRLVTESGSGSSSGAVTTSVRTISLGGLSLELDTAGDGEGATLRNVGIGGVPLTVDVGGSDALTLALQPFGASLDEESGTLTFDTALGVSLMIDNVTKLLEEEASDYRASFEAAVPAGTRLSEQENGTTRVEAGGPVSASFVASDAGRSVQSEISAAVGTCFGEVDEAEGADDADGDESLNLAVRPCDRDRVDDAAHLVP